MQDEAKKNIAKLVEKYGELKSEGKLKQYNEAQTRSEFIEPLFEFLGWDMKNWNNPNEVTTEEKVSNGRVDLAFRINGIPKFFLEAKSFKADLDVEGYSRQAMNYSWNKGVSWAVLTDFESLKLYNAQAKSKNLQDKLVFEITCEEYISDFDRLSLLSKNSFKNNELDKYAEKYGKKIKKQTVNEKLYDDLRTAREILTKKFGVWNENVDRETLDEGVQRILDRLVFIRVLEDKKLEEPILQPLVREWQQKHTGKQLFPMLIKKFRELNDVYDSNLFMKHACEEWEEYDDAVRKVIDLLYGTDMYEYDFKQIPADILGGVYESYLGYIAQNPIEVETDKKSGKLLKVEDKKELKLKSRKKRKEQGIYYTPKYIVDYIVKETLGKKLEEAKSIHELKQLKVLDPACGSGSFLTKALEAINDKYKDFSDPGNQATKTQILTENIHGVDLDPQAVELAKLNLLIDALDKKDKLPDLTENIRVGNSLISGNEEELKKYFGKKWHDKKPFNWEEEFSGVMKQGGFDVIIGNPPYGAELSREEKDCFSQKYKIGSTDTAILFVKHALDLLKKDGKLGFIIPKAFCFASNYKKLRDFVWDYVEEVVDCGKVWKQVKLEQVIMILRKREKLNKYKSSKFSNSSFQLLGEIEKKTAKEFGFFLNGVTDKEVRIAKKIKDSSVSLNSIGNNHRGAMLQKYVSEKGDLEVIGGAQIDRFGIRGVKGKVEESKIDSDQAYIKDNSVLAQRIVAHIENPVDHIQIISCVPESKGCVLVDTINQITLKKDFSPYFIWCLLNSKLISWYAYRFIFGKAIRTMQFDNPTTLRIPIPKLSTKDQKPLVEKAKKIMALHKTLLKIPKNSEKWKSVKRDIEKVDEKIDQKVYERYGLNDDEIKIIQLDQRYEHK